MALSHNLYYEAAGTGPAMVLIHGVVGSAKIWSELSPLLAKNYHAIGFDLLGYGHSPKPKGTYSAIRHIEAMRSTLQGEGIKPPYHLAGLSMGGLLAIEWAARYPAEIPDVVCIGLPYYATREIATERIKVNFWIRLVIEHPFVARLVISTLWPLACRWDFLVRLYRDRIYSDQIAHEALMVPYRAFASTIDQVMLGVRVGSWIQKIPTKPILVVQAAQDQWCAPAEIEPLTETYSNCRLVPIADSEHNLAILKPGETAAVILTFLSSV